MRSARPAGLSAIARTVGFRPVSRSLAARSFSVTAKSRLLLGWAEFAAEAHG